MLLAWVYALASVLAVSAVSLVGIVTIAAKMKSLEKILLLLVSFSAGALLGDAFFHLLPEASAGGFTTAVAMAVLAGIIASFAVEKLVFWRHCHVPTSDAHPHPFAYMNLFGDAVHNFIDGLVIGAAYMASVPVGIATTLAIVLHEIPQEMGDFAVLVHGGFHVRKALTMNFLTALTAVAGTVAALLAGATFAGATVFLVPFAAGGFIYIASSDLIPELHKHTGSKKALGQLLFILLGLAVMYAFLGMG